MGLRTNKRMRYLILFIFIFPISLFAEQTGNLLNQQFFNNNQGHGGWNCNDPSHNHGNSIVAGVHGDFIENTITLGDTLNQSEINGGWTSTLGADMWGWNEYDQEIKMTQTITDASGTVTTQIRDVAIAGCNGYNCGSYSTYTDSYTQGINNQSDYNIKVRFDFAESSQSTSHRAIDLKNPTLTIEHSLLSVTQQSTISEINKTVGNTIEQQVETIEFSPIEQFNFEVFEEPEMIVEMFEEIFFEEIKEEEINTGVISLFFEPIETIELSELPPIESFEEISMESIIEEYEEPKTLESFSTEIEIVEEEPKATEVITLAEEITETSNSERVTERQPVREEVSTGNSESREEEVVAEETNEPNEPSENNARESVEETDVQETETAQSESSNETRTESNESETSDNENERQVSESNVDSETDTNSTEVSEQTIESISVEKIATKVAEVVKEIDKQLVVTNIIIAKAMQSKINIDSYSSINNNLFNNQTIMNGGSYDEFREYVDNRNIYEQSQVIYNDDYSKYQENIDEAKANRIRAEEHLRRTRGY